MTDEKINMEAKGNVEEITVDTPNAEETKSSEETGKKKKSKKEKREAKIEDLGEKLQYMQDVF